MLSYLIVSALPIPRRRQWASHVLCIMAGLGAASCVVPRARYDEALERIRAERVELEAAHAEARSTEDELNRARAELEERDRIIASKEDHAMSMERAVAESQFAHEVVDVQRREQQALVEQLRGELGQVGRHLQGYSEKSRDLALRLEQAEARVEELQERQNAARVRFEVVRDLALALGPSIANEQVRLDVSDAGPVVRLRDAAVFEPKSGAIAPAASDVLARVARAVRPVPTAVVSLCDAEMTPRLEESASGAEASSTPASSSRTSQLAETLKNQGLAAERVIELPAGCPEALAEKAPVTVRIRVETTAEG